MAYFFVKFYDFVRAILYYLWYNKEKGLEELSDVRFYYRK